MFAAARVGLRSAAPVARRNASTQAGANVKKTCVHSLLPCRTAAHPHELRLTPPPCRHPPLAPNFPRHANLLDRSLAGSGRRGTSRPPSPSLPLSAPVSCLLLAPYNRTAQIAGRGSVIGELPPWHPSCQRGRRASRPFSLYATGLLLLTRMRIVPCPSQPASVRVGT